MQSTGEDAAPSPATTDSRFAALQARSERWTELCNELSAHAAELQSVRDTLRPRVRDVDVQESELEEERRRVEKQAAEIKRRWSLLQRCARQLSERARRLREREQEVAALEARYQTETSVRAAHIASETEARLVDTAVWVEQLDHCAAEFEDGTQRLNAAHTQMCAELDALAAPAVNTATTTAPAE